MALARYGRRTGTVAGYGYAARGAYRLGKTGAGIMKKWLKSGSKKTVGREDTNMGTAAATYGNLTSQYDTARLYRKKRAPRRVRRRAKRFIKQLKWGLDKLQGMKTCVISNSSTHTITPTTDQNAQQAVGLVMYGYGANTYAANSNKAYGDMWWIMSRENGGDPTVNSASRKLRFRSCTFNINIINRTPSEGGQGQNIIVDVYHVLCCQSVSDDTNSGDPVEIWNESIRELSGTNMPNEISDTNYEGVTPFDAPTFAKNYTVKSVRRYRLEAGGYFNLQLRDPANYVLGMSDLLDMNHKRNITEGYIFVHYNASKVGNVRGISSIELNYNKKYHYTETSTSQSQIGA